MLRLLQRGAKPFASLHPTSSSLSSLSPLTTQSPENERLENTLKVGDEFEGKLTYFISFPPILLLTNHEKPPPPTTTKKKKGYKLLQTQTYPTRNMKGMLFSHKQTGAKHLHIHSKDENNVFSVTFKTCPQDSRGVAHILEHTALCGSEKYPVRDPFFNMTRLLLLLLFFVIVFFFFFFFFFFCYFDFWFVLFYFLIFVFNLFFFFFFFFFTGALLIHT